MFSKFLALSFLILSNALFAEEDLALKVRIIANKSFSEKDLLDSYYRDQNPSNVPYSKSFIAMMKKISVEVSNQFKSDPSGLIGNSTCKLGCSNASSTVRLIAASAISPKIDLSRETRECEKICEVYFSSYHGFMQGIETGLANRPPASTDCAGAVSSGDRKFKPSLSPGGLEKAIQSSSGIKR